MTLPCRSRSNPSLSANERRKLGIGSHQEIDLANIRSDQRPMFADFVAARGHERIGREEAGAIQMTTLHPIRVLMILDTFRFGGAENLVAELGRFDPESLQVAVASLAPAEIAGDAMFGRLAAAGLKPTYLSVRRLLDLRGFFRLVRTLRLVPVDVVHTHLDYSAMLVRSPRGWPANQPSPHCTRHRGNIRHAASGSRNSSPSVSPAVWVEWYSSRNTPSTSSPGDTVRPGRRGG